MDSTSPKSKDETSSARPTSVVLDIEQGQQPRLLSSSSSSPPPPNNETGEPVLPTYTRPPTAKKTSDYGPFTGVVRLLEENPTAVQSGRYSIKLRQLVALTLILLVLGGLWFTKSEMRKQYNDALQNNDEQQEQQRQQQHHNQNHKEQPKVDVPGNKDKDGDDFWIQPVLKDSAPASTKEDRARAKLTGKALERYDRVRGKDTRTSLRKIQFNFPPETDVDRFVREQRQAKIRDGFAHAWQGYKKHAWGHDEVQPVAGGFRDSFNGWGATMIDSLDTLVIMGFNDEFDEALEWVKTSFSMTKNPTSQLSFFETVIRYLGGFLSAYDLTGEKVLLDKAEELGGYMLNAFVGEFPSGRVAIQKSANWAGGSFVLAEIGTIQVEFTRLSTLTGNPIYDQKAQNVIDILETATSDLPGVLPSQVSAGRNVNHRNFKASIGGMADSYYEMYSIVPLIFLGSQRPLLHTIVETAMDSVRTHMVSRPNVGYTEAAIIGSLYTGVNQIDTVMEHLSCFIAGSLAMGAKYFDRPEDMKLARSVAEGCYQGYHRSTTGIGPESMTFTPSPETNGVTFEADKDTFYKRGYGSNVYILRPETVESLWILYRLTGEKKYQDQAWEIFESIEKNCRTDIAYSGLMDVNQGTYDNKMESFFMAETMKYLYLMFSEPNVVSLDDFVFNTEAHPVRRT
ncbi:hypothetical protein BGZ83_003189 [Gryganskiella cystojenkinii]|nr:hypothetical protein BGZ83_003189 [Gryganskiella cystojenkinii]